MRQVLNLFVAVFFLFSSSAQAAPLSVLRDMLAKNPSAGTILKSFPAQDGLTGVVLKTPQGQEMIAYLTPDGRYLIAGAVIDLATGNNLTAQAAAKEIGKAQLPNAAESAKVIYTLGTMQAIVFGNATAKSYLAVVVDPSTARGRAILLETMQEAVNMHQQGTQATQQIRFFIYGPTASRLLAGSNVEQLRNLLAFAQGRPLPTPTPSSAIFAHRNDEAVKHLAVSAPLLAVFDPTSQFTRVIGLTHIDLSPGLLSGLRTLQSSLAVPPTPQP